MDIESIDIFLISSRYLHLSHIYIRPIHAERETCIRPLIERKKVPFILELCRHLRHNVGIEIEQMCIALYGECEFIVSTQIKMHILIYQIRTGGNKLNSITTVKLPAVLNNPGERLLVIGKPLPKVLHPLPERQVTVATTDELNRIFIFRSQFVRLLKASQSFLVSVEKVKCIPFPKVPISISGFFLLDGIK